MATLQLIEHPQQDGIVSAYTPIKFLCRVSGAPISGQAGNVTDYVSAKFMITPRNLKFNAWENDNADNVPSRVFSVRVPFTPYLHSSAPDNDVNDNSAFRYFSVDLSSVLRDFLSVDLRPCSHDTSSSMQRDITMSQISENIMWFFLVKTTPEFINSSGVLTEDTTIDIDKSFYVANSALSYQEEIESYLNADLLTESTTEQTPLLMDNMNQYVHNVGTSRQKARQKYLTIKPTRHRKIGTDESEYLTAIVQAGVSESIYVQIKFYDADGDVILNGDGGATFYGVNVNASAAGDGTLHASNRILSWGASSPIGEAKAAVQIGVGTRNIKELAMTNPDRFRDSQPLTDFSNVHHYTVQTLVDTNPYEAVGEPVTYYIDHSRIAYHQNTRFHWQNRLGGIDSYTFDGTATRGLETSSSSYEQSIYKHFNSQAGSSDTNQNVFTGTSPNLISLTTSGGALVPRIGGFTDDKYHAVNKHKVDAYGVGSALSKPISQAERGMMEDIMSSPNVWTERGWVGQEIFKEDFSGYAGVANISDNWTDASSGDFTTNASFVTADGHITGTSAYQKGDNSGEDQAWASSKTILNFNPDKMYMIEARVKKDAASDGKFYAGFTGYAADGTTKINTSGADSLSSQHYIASEGTNITNDDTWVTYRGYVNGHIRPADDAGGQRNTPVNPARAYTGVKKFAPMFILNLVSSGTNAGIMYLDYIKVVEYSPAEETQKNFYSPLNRNYYVPVVMKDSTIQTQDTEGFTTISVDYVESRKKRTLRN